jgi:hypothetical protein
MKEGDDSDGVGVVARGGGDTIATSSGGLKPTTPYNFGVVGGGGRRRASVRPLPI